MTDLEPSSDWRTWSITVPSPASEQSVTSSPLQTSATLYSIFRIIATPFLKFFSIFLSFFSSSLFSSTSQKFNPRLPFSAAIFFLVSVLSYPRVRAYHFAGQCQRIRVFHLPYTQTFHKLFDLQHIYFCVFYTTQSFVSPSTFPIFAFPVPRFHTLARFSTSYQTSDVSPVFRFTAFLRQHEKKMPFSASEKNIFHLCFFFRSQRRWLLILRTAHESVKLMAKYTRNANPNKTNTSVTWIVPLLNRSTHVPL